MILGCPKMGHFWGQKWGPDPTSEMGTPLEHPRNPIFGVYPSQTKSIGPKTWDIEGGTIQRESDDLGSPGFDRFWTNNGSEMGSRNGVQKWTILGVSNLGVQGTHLGSQILRTTPDPWDTPEMLPLPWIGTGLYRVDPGCANMTVSGQILDGM